MSSPHAMSTPLESPFVHPPQRRLSKLGTVRKIAPVIMSAMVAGAVLAYACAGCAGAGESAMTAAGRPALTVAITRLRPTAFVAHVIADGNVAPWQEASIGAETDGLRLREVLVDVGDQVRRGQTLATFAADVVEAELAQSRATVAETGATLAQATDNARRARLLEPRGVLSAQQTQQAVTAASTAQARWESAVAAERLRRVRLAQARVVAPDDGIVSARNATVGAVPATGQELFRLIRGGKLQWRAEVAAASLAKLAPGQQARVTLEDGSVVEGRVRALAPAIDLQTRNGLAFVDLPPDGAARAGMFVRGEFELGTYQAMVLPVNAIQQQEGFSYAIRVGADSRASRIKVATGRRSGDLVEILSGIGPQDRIVAAGGAFLNEGDLVRVVEQESAAHPALDRRMGRGSP